MPGQGDEDWGPIPARIGPYEIVQPLARGGMAAVYLVRRAGPGGFARHAAMKLVRPELALDPELRAMFLDEARLAARILHTHVVHIEELGEQDGRLYLVMEYVPGVTLADFLDALTKLRRGLSVPMAVALAGGIAAGLHAAHETRDGGGQLLHVVHRDVSPQNVLLGVNGAVKLIDFGIARSRNKLYQTRPDLVRGKLHYMAPEQLQGAPVDRRADLYSLGVVVWELLTQTRLFRGDNAAQIIYAITRGDLPPPGAFGGVPHTVDRLVMRMLAPRPEQRPASAREVRTELKNALPDAFFIEDDEIAALLLGACEPLLRSLPDLETARPLNTAEISVRPTEALSRHTRPVDSEAGATVAGLSERTSSPTETLERVPIAAPTDGSARTQIGVPGAPSRAALPAVRTSSPDPRTPDPRTSSPGVAAVQPSPVFPEKSRTSLPDPVLPQRTIPIWLWVVAAALVGGAIGLLAYAMR